MRIDNARCAAVFDGLEHFRDAVSSSGSATSSTSTNPILDLGSLPCSLPIAARTRAAAASLRERGSDREAAELERAHLENVLDLRLNLYRQGNLKKELRTQHSLEAAAALMTVALEGGTRPVLARRSLRGMREHLQAEASDYWELVAPTTFRIASPRTYGGSVAEHQWALGRTVFVGSVSHAIVRHRSSLVRVGDTLLIDAQDDERADIGILFEVDPSVMAHDGDGLVTFEQVAGPTIDLPKAVHLGGVPSRAFGHWIVQFLLKLFAARQAGHLLRVPILVDADMPATHREALTYFLDDDTDVVEIPAMGLARVARLWLLADWLYVPLCPAPGQDLGPKRLSLPPAETAATLRAMIVDKPTPARTDAKLFIARRPACHRKMVNHARILDIAIELGFQVVYLEDHSFEKQMELIRSADTIVGPDGSSHILCLFAQPRTKITMLSHGFLENNAGLFAIFAALDLDALILHGRCVREDPSYRRFSDYEIDEVEFRQVATR